MSNGSSVSSRIPAATGGVALACADRPTDATDATPPATGEWADTIRALYERHGAALVSYVAKSTHDRGLAEDIVQETLFRAWRKEGTLRVSEADARPWLFTVARNLTVDHFRRRAARPREVSDFPLMFRPVEDGTDEQTAALVVRSALASLSPAHREVLTLVHLRGHSAPETARMLGIPPGTVKSRVHYAIRALRIALEERGVTNPHC
jgi:RNA polymerase sigma-70 factor (ECF subfamily)